MSFVRRPVRITIVLASMAVWLFAASPVRGADVRVERTTVPMTDGVRLVTSIWLPEEEGGRPTILMRTPYGIENKAWLADHLARHGYAVVIQSVRGKDGSGGVFFPFAHEKEDGLATLDWVLEQPWCDGDVGLWGASYLGFAAFEIASTGHPAVKSVMHLSGWADLEPFMMHGGAFHLMAHLPWFAMFTTGQNPPPEAWARMFQTTPVAGLFRGAEEGMRQLMAKPYDYARFQASVLHVTGWYDYIYVNTLETYRRISAEAPGAGEQRLVVGVWPHNGILQGTTEAGDEDFGEPARWGLEVVQDLTLEWFDYQLRDVDVGLGAEPPVRLFLMGDNVWREFESWPPEDVVFQSWYASRSRPADGSGGAGALSTSPGSEQETDSFLFDPDDPVPTRGGANVHFFPDNLGVLDQRELGEREDVLVYTSAPLEQSLILAGPVRTRLWAATEGADTDFTAKLVQVRPDGYARNIVDGIVRASHQFALAPDGAFEPGQVHEYRIDMGATALVVEPGSRLRLEISSSNFPKYTRNPNTGEDAMTATELVPVTQTVHHTAAYPTQVVLPVLEMGSR